MSENKQGKPELRLVDADDFEGMCSMYEKMTGRTIPPEEKARAKAMMEGKAVLDMPPKNPR